MPLPRMPLPRDAAPTADRDRGTGGRGHFAALAPGCRAPLRRRTRRPCPTDGGAGRRVLDLDPGCGTGASAAAPTAAFPGAGTVFGHRAHAEPDGTTPGTEDVKTADATGVPGAGRPRTGDGRRGGIHAEAARARRACGGGTR
ncbi:hypothetical protein ACFYN5_27720 [Streptomyces sp. NPDC007126]|uniref:hypothetical protein n=1 Tax=Streptomyces sp. NPDC007126 TaxID=3364774 RepID=UPI0036B0C62F